MQKYKKPDRRSFERYKLRHPVRILVYDSQNSKRNLIGASTRDISGVGAFVNSIQPVTKGKALKFYLSLPISGLDVLIMERLDINIAGEVVRTEKNGFAIKFSEAYQIKF